MKKVISWLILLLICIIIFSVTTVTIADFGDFESYDSVGSEGASSLDWDYDGGHDWDSSNDRKSKDIISSLFGMSVYGIVIFELYIMNGYNKLSKTKGILLLVIASMLIAIGTYMAKIYFILPLGILTYMIGSIYISMLIDDKFSNYKIGIVASMCCFIVMLLPLKFVGNNMNIYHGIVSFIIGLVEMIIWCKYSDNIGYGKKIRIIDFDEDIVKINAKKIFMKYANALKLREIEEIKPYASDLVLEQISNNIKRCIETKQINIMNDIIFEKCDIINIYKYNGKTLEIVIKVSMLDYTIDESDRKIIQGSNSEKIVCGYKMSLIHVYSVDNKKCDWILNGIEKIN